MKLKPEHFDWLQRKFGRCSAEERERCEVCDAAGKEMCTAQKFTEKHSPRYTKDCGQTKSYTPIPNAVTHAWFDSPETEVRSSGFKMTYLFLLTYTRDDRKRKDTRVVWDDIPKLAEIRGITVRTMRQHIKELEKLKLIRTCLLRHFDPNANPKAKAIILLDLPAWIPGREKFKKVRKSWRKDEDFESMSSEELEEYESDEDQQGAVDVSSDEVAIPSEVEIEAVHETIEKNLRRDAAIRRLDKRGGNRGSK